MSSSSFDQEKANEVVKTLPYSGASLVPTLDQITTTNPSHGEFLYVELAKTGQAFILDARNVPEVHRMETLTAFKSGLLNNFGKQGVALGNLNLIWARKSYEPRGDGAFEIKDLAA